MAGLDEPFARNTVNATKSPLAPMLFVKSTRRPILGLLLLLTGCVTETQPDLDASTAEYFRTLGIIQTGPNGEEYETWGETPAHHPDFGDVDTPYEGPGIVPAFILEMPTPYPNPTNASVTIAYATGLDSHSVTIRALRSLGPSETPSDPDNPNPEVKLIDSVRYRRAGFYTRVWDLSDHEGNKVSTGFYRVFLNVNEYELWRDVAVNDDGQFLE